MAVQRGHSGARVDQEEGGIGVGQRCLRLAAHGGLERVAGRVLQPGGIHDGELQAAERTRALPAVARHARAVVHDRLAPSDEAVEQGRFADIGSSDDGDDGPGHCGQR